MEVYKPYLIALSITTGIAFLRGDERLLRCALAVLGNWIINTAYCIISDTYDPWYTFIIVDTATAWLILMRPAGFWQGFLGGLYLIQIMVHFGYGATILTNDYINLIRSDAKVFYWQVLTWIGWMQIGTLAVWGIGNGGIARRVSALRRFRSDRGAAASAHYESDR